MLVALDFWTISSSQETSIIAILMKDVSKFSHQKKSVCFQTYALNLFLWVIPFLSFRCFQRCFTELFHQFLDFK